MNRIIYSAIFFLLLFTNIGLSQNSLDQYYTQIKQYEPNEKFPFGQLNPNAPEEVKQFDFMVGVCECQDSVLTAPGNWISYPSIWQAKYFLNGMAIQDNSFNPRNPTTNLRVFDPSTSTWKVTYLQSQAGYFTGIWEGKKQGDKLVLSQEQTNSQGQKTISRLTFFNISNDGYDWKSESINGKGEVQVSWKKQCKKRKT